MVRLAAWAGGLGVVLLAGCGGPGARPAPGPALGDTGLPNRCKVAASQDRPLVTEWSAPEKANLESLASGQAIAVRYTGCELQVLGSCKVPGRYAYRRTTLATDTLDIQSADDLYAKLPIGAFGLEGELSRSGRLAVRTTVAGQFQLEGAPAQVALEGACAEATHLVTGISVGAFSLLTGGAEAAGAGATVAGVGAGARTRREESVMRQAGDPKSCAGGDGKAPDPMCGSPIQVFLLRVGASPGGQRPDDALADRARLERRAREQGVLMDIPAPREPGEVWKLHDAEGRTLCQAPCSQWVAPRSGFYLERAPTSGAEGVRIDVPNDLPHAPGTRVGVDYGPEKGMPFVSKLTFYGLGIPAGGASIGLGIAYVASDPDSRFKSFYLIGSIFYGLSSAASTWWFFYSDEKHFRTRAAASARLPWSPVRVGLAPGGLVGALW